MIRRRLLQLFAAALFPFDAGARTVAAYHAQTVLPTDGDEAMPVEQAIRELIDNSATYNGTIKDFTVTSSAKAITFHIHRLDGEPASTKDVERVCQELARLMAEVFEQAGREAGA